MARKRSPKARAAAVKRLLDRGYKLAYHPTGMRRVGGEFGWRARRQLKSIGAKLRALGVNSHW